MNTAEYLINKLRDFGIFHYFGLPGDFNLNIIYTVQNTPDTEWIGCTNELNAGYAADGYARENGFGALITTYGVGELSAINAIAGSYSENISVIHIVGTPTTEILNSGNIGHHFFQNGNPFCFYEMYKNVTETGAILNRDNAKIEIDRILKIFKKERKPVYIAIPADIATMEIKDKEILLDWYSDEENLSKVVTEISEKLRKSEAPIIVADSLIERFDAKKEFNEFVEKTGIPLCNFLMGKNAVNTKYEKYLGTYFTDIENNDVNERLIQSDCPIFAGSIYSDMNTCGMKLDCNINSKIAIYGTYTYINNIKYENVKMSDVFNRLTKAIDYKEYNYKPKLKNEETNNNPPEGDLTIDYFYKRLKEFLNSDDRLYIDTGSYTLGAFNTDFKENVKLNSQIFWNSIGWATPACFGAAVAQKDKNIILVTGEGAHQITALEIGTMLRFGVKPVIIVINNGGYTIERLLSDNMDDKFNDINQMDYPKFARSFKGEIWATSVSTADDFDKALRVTKIMKKLCYIEVIIDKADVPENKKSFLNGIKSKKQTKQKHKKIFDNFKLKEIKDLKFGTTTHKSLHEIENGD